MIFAADTALTAAVPSPSRRQHPGSPASTEAMETQLFTRRKSWTAGAHRRFAVKVIAIFCNALWGSAFPFIKMGYRLFAIETADTASILCFAGVRFMLGSVLVLGGSLLLEGRLPAMPQGRSWPKVLCIGPVADHSAVCLFL